MEKTVRFARFADEPKDASPGMLLFWCPACDEAHYYRIKTEPGDPSAPVWAWNGNREKPTLTPSLHIRVVVKRNEKGEAIEWRTKCHLFLLAGEVQYCGDCPHAMKGKTIPLAPWPEHSRRFRENFFGKEEGA